MATKKIKNDKVKNIYHPDFAGMIEPAFKVRGQQMYCFKSDSSGRYGRYIVMQAFLQEYYLRVDLNTLKGDIKRMQNWLNPTAKDGRLEIGKCLEQLSIMEQRANIAFEPETVYRLASCLYFDDQEILSGYDKAHNEKKIELWKKHGDTDFFFHKLFQDATGLIATSKEDLKSYLEKAPELTKGWRTITDILMQ